MHSKKKSMWVFVCDLKWFCGLAAAPAWLVSRLSAEGRWECGEFGRDQLIKLCALALSRFPCRQGTKSKREATQAQSWRVGVSNTFFTYTHSAAAQLTQRSRPIAASFCGVIVLTSFSSAAACLDSVPSLNPLTFLSWCDHSCLLIAKCPFKRS